MKFVSYCVTQCLKNLFENGTFFLLLTSSNVGENYEVSQDTVESYSFFKRLYFLEKLIELNES